MNDPVVSTLLRHKKLIAVMADAIADLSCLVDEMLPRCVMGCENVATVTSNSTLACRMCDRCAAEAIVESGDNPSTWTDLPNAERIRRTQEFVKLLKEHDPTEEH